MLHYKLIHTDPEFHQLDFLGNVLIFLYFLDQFVIKQEVCLQEIRQKPRKKRNILHQLVQFMTISRRKFWQDIEEADDVEDLLTCY